MREKKKKKKEIVKESSKVVIMVKKNRRWAIIYFRCLSTGVNKDAEDASLRLIN